MTLRVASWVMVVISAIVLAATMANAETTQDRVLSCFSEIGTSTDWNICLNSMFAPCADAEVGGASHLQCLSEQREDWRLAKTDVETPLLAALTEDGLAEFYSVMSAWPAFVEDKCTVVAQSRAEISFEAAAIGCQISELALITNELTACLDGRSREAYCQLKAE